MRATLTGIAIAAAVLAAGCDITTTGQQVADWASHLPTIEATATNAPTAPATPPETQAAQTPAPADDSVMTAKKIPHGKAVTCAAGETPDSASEVTVNQKPFRIYDMSIDGPVGRQAMKAKAVRVIDGKTVADDFINDAGQVEVWDHFDNGTADDGHEVYENPAVLKDDSRIRYRCFEAVAQ